MIVIPDSIVEFYHGVPLDNTYENTILFADMTAQNNYFHGNIDILSKRVDKNSYVRIERGVIRVEATVRELYSCNYLAFRNSSFGEGWFYAFVTNVEYVNNATVDVSFEIDVMQTYMFDYVPMESFVLREHAVNDSIGANLLSEPVEIGELTASSIVESEWFNSYCVVIAFNDLNPQGAGDLGDGRLYHQTPCGCYFAFYPTTADGITGLRSFLGTVNELDKVDNIISMFVVPTEFTSVPSLPYTITPDTPREIGALPTQKIDSISRPHSLNGYTPRNKKLLTYPYTCLRVDCGANQKVYKYEYFSNPDYASFQLTGCYANTPEISVAPRGYMSNTASRPCNYNEEVILSDFPQMSYSNSAYKSWIATKAPMIANSELIGGATSLLGMGAGVITGNPLVTAGAGLSGFSTLLNASTQRHVAGQTAGTQIKGRGSSSVDSSMQLKKPFYISMQMRADLARRADDFLDKYGYNTQMLKVPNRNSRPHWNYVKTAGFNCVGNIPQKYLKKICSIYDNGITFWKSPSEVGNYSLNNH